MSFPDSPKATGIASQIVTSLLDPFSRSKSHEDDRFLSKQDEQPIWSQEESEIPQARERVYAQVPRYQCSRSTGTKTTQA